MNEYKCGHCCGGLCIEGCNKTTDKLNTYDWLADLPGNTASTNIVEVTFKPPRKGYFINANNLELQKGDIVAVEASPGHDIGTVTMTGALVALQIKKANLKPDVELKKIYRKARQVDMDKYREAKAHEHETMIESRQIALDLGLKMKIGDVEYQGDGNKAIFYYIADERVDFRQLIKVLAERFRVRIEMKQIGARQEAGRIGGIGPCGRELCCATWMTNFVSVSTSAARFQDISLNPQKLAGQCAKLKCCMNFEVDQYVEALKRLPSKEIVLQTLDSDYYFFKADILRHLITYSTDKHLLVNEKTISARRAFDIINLNRSGQKPESLLEDGENIEKPSLDLVEQENINRFDKKKGERRNRGERRNNDKRGAERNENRENRGERNENRTENRENRNENRENRGERNENRNENRENRNENRENRGERNENRGENRENRNDRRDRRNRGPRPQNPQNNNGGGEPAPKAE